MIPSKCLVGIGAETQKHTSCELQRHNIKPIKTYLQSLWTEDILFAKSLKKEEAFYYLNESRKQKIYFQSQTDPAGVQGSSFPACLRNGLLLQKRSIVNMIVYHWK